MIHREYLVMRKALAWYACIAFALMLLDFTGIHVAASDGGIFDYATVVMTAGVFAAAFAWIFGVGLGNGSREAARVLWLLPQPRWKVALQLIAVDLVAVTVAYAIECAVMLVFFGFASLRSGVQIHGAAGIREILLTLALVYAMYGWSALVGMIGRRVPYCGLLAAPALAAWLTIAQSHTRIGNILRAPIVANPIAVFNTALAFAARQQYHNSVDGVSLSLQWLAPGWEAPVLFGIAIATCGLAVMLWQRAETIA